MRFSLLRPVAGLALALLLPACAGRLVHDPLDRNLAQNNAAQAVCETQHVQQRQSHTTTALCYNAADEVYFSRVSFPWMDLVHDLETTRLAIAGGVDSGRVTLQQGQEATALAIKRFSDAIDMRAAIARQRHDGDALAALATLNWALTPPQPPQPVPVYIVP